MKDRLVFDCVIYDSYRELLKKKVYEPIILKLMNESEIIFPEEYSYIEDQTHNESDFISDSGICYDAKILFYEKQCQALAINKDHLATFMEGLQREINEIYEAIQNNDEERLSSSIFYQEMVSRIRKANEGENIILFIPFSCTLELSDHLESLLKSDIFTYIFRCILKKEQGIIRNNNIYIIYPNCENYIIIKNLNTDQMEFLMDSVFLQYIRFVVVS